MPHSKNIIYYELEKISHKDLQNYRIKSRAFNSYFTEHYQYFSEQRRKIFEELKDSLRINCTSLKFKNFQRAASYKYCLSPLSARGSILNGCGGRFNIGQISPNIPKFGALYVANDTETAIKEAFQIGIPATSNGLTNEDMALLNAKSFCIVQLEGELEQVLDLSAPQFASLDRRGACIRTLIRNDVGDVKERIPFQTDIHEGRIHARQHVLHDAFED